MDREWNQNLDEIVHAINRTNNSTTKESPFVIEYGYDGINPNDKIRKDVRFHKVPLADLHHQVHKRIQSEKETRVNRNKNEGFEPYSEGQLVLAKRMTSKFPRFLGPYEVVTSYADGLSYKLKDINTTRTIIRRVEHLKLYHARQSRHERPEHEPIPVEQNDPQVDPVDYFGYPDLLFPIDGIRSNAWIRSSQIRTSTPLEEMNRSQTEEEDEDYVADVNQGDSQGRRESEPMLSPMPSLDAHNEVNAGEQSDRLPSVTTMDNSKPDKESIIDQSMNLNESLDEYSSIGRRETSYHSLDDGQDESQTDSEL